MDEAENLNIVLTWQLIGYLCRQLDNRLEELPLDESIAELGDSDMLATQAANGISYLAELAEQRATYWARKLSEQQRVAQAGEEGGR